MTRHQIVRRELRFNVRLGNNATDAHIHSLENLRNVDVEVDHRRIEAVIVVVLEQLITEQSAGNHEAIIESVNAGDAKAPVDMVCLEFVRHAFDVENELILLETIRPQIVDEWKIRVRPAFCIRRSAHVPGKVFPPVNLDQALLPCFAIRSGLNRFH